MRSYRIGVLGDTHVPESGVALPKQIEDEFQGVDLIFHVGDVTGTDVLRDLSRIAPVVAVRGDSDPPDLPRRIVVPVDRVRIALIHGNRPVNRLVRTTRHAQASTRGAGWEEFLQHLVSCFPPVDCIVFGHLHRPYMAWHGSVFFFSPGSVFQRTPEMTRAELAANPPLPRRRYLERWLAAAERDPDRAALPPSLGLLTVSQGKIQAEVHPLSSLSGRGGSILAVLEGEETR
jgi:putative phosphoesterase